MTKWKVFVPRNAILGGYYAQAINKNAPHPAAARLWEEFLYSPGRERRAEPVAGGRGQTGGAGGHDRQRIHQHRGGREAALVTGTPVFLTPTQITDAANYLAANWAKAVG